jgi:hypothetical protein
MLAYEAVDVTRPDHTTDMIGLEHVRVESGGDERMCGREACETAADDRDSHAFAESSLTACTIAMT